MNSKFPLDGRKICAYLCIYNCMKKQILSWIRDYQLNLNQDFITEGDEHYFTSSAAQKIYMSYLAKSR